MISHWGIIKNTSHQGLIRRLFSKLVPISVTTSFYTNSFFSDLASPLIKEYLFLRILQRLGLNRF